MGTERAGAEAGSPQAARDDADSLRGLPILVVDDLALDRKLLRVLLTAAGCDVRTTESGRAALTLLVELRPRIIVTDVRMRDGDGLELTRRVKAKATTRDIVIVAVSAYSVESAARASGCDAFIGKPIDVATFADQLRACLR